SEALELRYESTQELVENVVLNENSSRRGAVLTRVIEGTTGDDGQRVREVGVGEDHDRRVAAQFEDDGLWCLRREFGDASTSTSRTREGCERDEWVLDERFTGNVTSSVYNVEHTGGKDFRRELGEGGSSERRILRRLHDNRVAGGERGRNLPNCLPEWVVPRRDGPNHAERLTSQIERVVSDVVTTTLAGQHSSRASEVAKCGGDRWKLNLPPRGLGFSRVGDLEIRESLKVTFEKVSDAMEELRTLARRKLSPRGKGTGRSLHGVLDVGC